MVRLLHYFTVSDLFQTFKTDEFVVVSLCGCIINR